MTGYAALSELAEINPSMPAAVQGSGLDRLVPFLPMSAVSEQGSASYEQRRPISELLQGYTYFERGDVLLAKITPCLENGKAAYLGDLPDHLGFGSTEFHVLRPRPGVDPRYLFHAVWSTAFRRAGVASFTGSAGQKRLPASFFDRYKVPFPPLAEQRRIAAVLDKADGIRSKQRESLWLLDEFLRSAFLEMFGDPVRNEKEWDSKRLGDLAVIRRGASPRPIQQFLGGTIPWIKIGDATRSGGLFIERTAERVTEAGAARSVRLELGSIVVANSGVSLGFARILAVAGCIHDGWLSVEHLPDSVNKMYFICFINLMTQRLRRSAPTGTQPNLNVGILADLRVPMPPIQAQGRFDELVASYIGLSARLRAAAAAAEQLFDSIAQRVFGEPMRALREVH